VIEPVMADNANLYIGQQFFLLTPLECIDCPQNNPACPPAACSAEISFSIRIVHSISFLICLVAKSKVFLSPKLMQFKATFKHFQVERLLSMHIFKKTSSSFYRTL